MPDATEKAPAYLPSAVSPSALKIRSTKKRKLQVMVPNRCPSVTIRPTETESVIPVLPCNSDPATVNIPIRGKVLATWCLAVLWTGVMVMTLIVGEFKYASPKENPMLGPPSSVLIEAGAIAPSKLDDRQYWRLLWATQMHAGWLHLGLNIANFVPLGYILEPDWGLTKTLAIFLCSAVTGSLASVNGGLNTAVGASGGIFGLMGGLMIYVFEYWGTIPHNKVILITVVAIVAISIAVSFVPYVDKWAHVGGCAGGMLATLALLRDLPAPVKATLHCKKDASVDEEGRPAESGAVPSASPKNSHEASRDPISVNRDASLSEKIRVYRVSQDIYADVPAMAHPAIIKTVNSRAKRWVNFRKSKRTADPKSWNPEEDSYDRKSPIVWTLRVTAALLLVASWVIMVQTRFGLLYFFTGSHEITTPEVVSAPTLEVTRRLMSDGFLARIY